MAKNNAKSKTEQQTFIHNCLIGKWNIFDILAGRIFNNQITTSYIMYKQIFVQ